MNESQVMEKINMDYAPSICRATTSCLCAFLQVSLVFRLMFCASVHILIFVLVEVCDVGGMVEAGG
jgi:hypothetical protein